MDDFNQTEEQKEFDWSERIYNYVYLAKLLLKRLWWVPVLIMLLGICIGTYNESKKQPTYTSYSRMIIGGMVDVQEGDSYRESTTNFFGTQIELMRSEKVHKKAKERVRALHPGIQESWAKLFAQQLPETTIFVLQVTGGDEKYVPAYLNAVMEEYSNYREEMRYQTSELTQHNITEQLIRLEDEIEVQEQQIVEFQRQNNLVFIQEQGTTAGTHLNQLENELSNLKSELRTLESLAVDGLSSDTPRHIIQQIIELGRKDVIEAYRFEELSLKKLETERDAFAIYLKAKHPKIIELNQEIERSTNLLKIMRRDSINEAMEKKLTLNNQIQNLQELIEEWNVTALDNSRLLAEFEQMESRIERSRNTYERLLSSIQSIDLNQQLASDIIDVLERASPALVSNRNIPVKAFQGAAGGFVMGCFILAFLGAIDNRILSANDLKKHFKDIPVLGTIPQEGLNESGKVELLQPKDTRHFFSEACRALRSSLLFLQGPPGTGRPELLMVTSSIPEEGKSTIATNLAISLAFTQSKTLLVDADLRRGHIAEVLGLPAFPGLSDALNHGRNIRSVIQETAIENLDFIATGDFPERPGELLLSTKMDVLLSKLRGDYEYIIIDTAPILATDDTSGFSVKSDGVLFVTRSTHTHVKQAEAAIDRLRMRGANVSGLILNGVDLKGTDYYYYNKYNNHYAYAQR